ncbi:ComF family protein [Nocardioides mangrovi]|uniref:ComF family protein n=1 Tax=Nocardioides mangrovi TaxID=2874580 RepID=A0ABS7U8M7_9ACTN|nr:phosphoribosyltransferase family protein [Nocardioides mangrovi]MBZ5737321.1 ComF family protein [Nocardioides mangrovi]
MAGSGFRDVVDGGVDLLLGGRCVGCARPGRVLCEPCAATLPDSLPDGGRPAWPTPVPAGLVPPWAAGEYAGVVRAMVVGHKERRLLGLRPPLARLLAVAVAAAVADLPPGPVVLVPVPSRRGSARARGHDPLGAVTRAAGRRLRAEGRDVRVAPLLRSRSGVVDQAGLDAAARAANLASSMCCPTGPLRRLAARTPAARVVVCDDVITTGATLREAQRALEGVGLTVVAAAAVAATRRRSSGRDLRPLSSLEGRV